MFVVRDSKLGTLQFFNQRLEAFSRLFQRCIHQLLCRCRHLYGQPSFSHLVSHSLPSWLTKPVLAVFLQRGYLGMQTQSLPQRQPLRVSKSLKKLQVDRAHRKLDVGLEKALVNGVIPIDCMSVCVLAGLEAHGRKRQEIPAYAKNQQPQDASGAVLTRLLPLEAKLQ